MNKKKLARVIAAAVLAITAGGGYALGATAPITLNSNGPFYACVTPLNGNITRVTNTPKTCPKGTSAIQWNSVGPKGDKGEKGEKGDSGEPGMDAGFRSNLAVLQYVSSGNDKFPIVTYREGRDFVRINGALWRYEQINQLILWSPHVARPTIGADGWFDSRAANEVLLYLDQNCKGQTYGYLSPLRSSPQDLSVAVSYRRAYLSKFEDEAVKMAYADQAYKAHSSSRLLSEFQSWKDEFGCHNGAPETRFIDSTLPWVVRLLTPVETPTQQFDALITVE